MVHKKLLLIAAFLLISLILISSCSSIPKTQEISCNQEDVDLYIKNLKSLLEEFDDIVTVASSTSRIALSPEIREMQSLKRKIRNLDHPECANYLHDLVLLAVETQINAFISFLSQDSDTVVARKMSAANEARRIVDKELSAFQEDPLEAYRKAEITAESLIKELSEPEPFVLPEGWQNITFPNNEDLIVSIPSDWEWEHIDELLKLTNNDKTLLIGMSNLDESLLSEFDSDQARLFLLQTSLETESWDFYSEQNAEVGVYGLNRGYVVRFSYRPYSSSDISEAIRAVIITPEDQEILVLATTERDEFAKIDLLLFEQILSSIRIKD